MDDLKLAEEKTCAPDSQEMIDEMWEFFGEQEEYMRLTSRDIAPYHWDLDEEYN